ncbi:unnamed protein product [Cochlearia groenlandica]
MIVFDKDGQLIVQRTTAELAETTTDDEPSVRVGTSSLCMSKESAGEELTPSFKRKESLTKEITQEELTPTSKRKESEDVVCGESLDAPDQGYAVKKVCSVAIKQEKIDW